MLMLESRTVEEVYDNRFYYKAGINNCLQRGGGDCTAEQVLDVVYEDRAAVLDVIENQEPLGFIVLSEGIMRYSGKHELSVDFAYIQGAKKTLALYDAVCALGRELEFDRLTFGSDRKGWQRYLKHTDFTANARYYSKDFTYE